MHPYARFSTAAALGVTLCSGCAQNDVISVGGSVLTDGSDSAQGRRVPLIQFSTQDTVAQLVDFNWPDPTIDGGRHKVVWKWYHGNQLLSQSGCGASNTTPLLFATTPWTLHTQRAAASLGIGHFKVQTVVDDNVVATNEFDAKP